MEPSASMLFDPVAFLAKAGSGRTMLHLEAHQAFFTQGSNADCVYFLQNGRAKITVVSAEGKEATITLVSPHDFFGEESIASVLGKRSATAIALCSCTALRIERAEMLRVLHEEHSFSDMFLQVLITRGLRTQADLVDHLFNSSEKRLARILLLMSEFGECGKPESLIPRISQESMAEMIGTTRSRVSFFMNRFRELGFVDYEYPVNSVFNAGAVRVDDGDTLLLCRVEDRRGLSHLCAARSANGIDGWRIDPKPTLEANPREYPEEIWGIEDPRITFVPELKQYAIAYTSFSRGGPGVSLALTKDFRTFERYGVIMSPEDKDAALLPRRVGGLWALVHRPMTTLGAHMWISYSPDLRHWGGHQVMLEARRGGWWDANKIGLCSPLIETDRGWLAIYHGVRNTAAGSIYRLGLALFDLEKPNICLQRGDCWMFSPEAPYERSGDVPEVVFPCGQTIGADGDTINLYYGAADSCMALATGSIRTLFSWLDANPSWGDDPLRP